MLDFELCCPRRKEGLVLRNLGEEAILYNPDTKKAHVLNTTSLLIWDLCNGDQSLALIENTIKSRFAVDDDSDVRADIEETIMSLSSEGLLTLESKA